MLQSTSQPTGPNTLFGAAAVYSAGSGFAFEDRRFDPSFPLGLFCWVPSLAGAQGSIDATFPPYRRLPRPADLAYAKNVVKVLRSRGLTQASHTKALNVVAGFWGYRSWGALQGACTGELETVELRRSKLGPIAALVLERLEVDATDLDFTELVQHALGIPVLEYTFERYPSNEKPVLRLYSNGVAHVHLAGNFPAVYGYDLAKLGLQAIEYHVGALKDVDTVEDLLATPQQELLRLALWMSAPYESQRQLREATTQELAEALENSMPLSHFALLVHPVNGAVHAGDHNVLLALPAFYDGAIAVASAVADGHSLRGDEPEDSNTLDLSPLSAP